MTAQTTNYGTRNGQSATTVAQFGVVTGDQQIDFALVSFGEQESLMQVTDGKYHEVTSYPKSMTARQAYEATLAHNAAAEVFVAL